MNILEARRRMLGAGVYKKTVTGNPAIAQGSLARMYPGITMQGWTEQESTTGAQIFNKNTVDKNKYISDSDGEVYEGSVGRETSASDYIQVSGLSYVFATETEYGQWMAFYDKDKNFISGLNGYGSLQVPQSAEYARFTILSSAIDTFMVNEGSTALPWEPYTGGAPSPSPDYPQEIVSAGKWNEETQKYEYGLNLTGKNLNPVSQMENIYTEYNSGYIKWTGKKAVYYKVLAKADKEDGYVFLGVDYYDENFNKLGDNGITLGPGSSYKEYSGLFTGRYANNGANVDLSTTVSYIRVIIFKYSSTAINVSFKDLMISDMDLPYEPYKPPQTVTLTSDRPLTKWDKLTKKDGQWGWEYGSAEIVFDGSDDEIWGFWNNGFYIIGGLENISKNSIILMQSLCDKFSYTNPASSDVGFIITSTGGSSSPRFWINGLLDIADWRNFLSENNVIYLYPTETPAFTPLSASEQEALNALHTNHPTTVLSNDAGCEMSLTYKTRKSMEVTT